MTNRGNGCEGKSAGIGGEGRPLRRFTDENSKLRKSAEAYQENQRQKRPWTV